MVFGGHVYLQEVRSRHLEHHSNLAELACVLFPGESGWLEFVKWKTVVLFFQIIYGNNKRKGSQNCLKEVTI